VIFEAIVLGLLGILAKGKIFFFKKSPISEAPYCMNEKALTVAESEVLLPRGVS